ncbi:MAG: hypothetical protein IJ279_07345 [Clostridia bacterium]|nr:hypothetical protein [Clostridia bacterium]
MKIKGSIKNLKINTAFILAAIGTVVAVGARVYQAFSGLVDFETGFFTENHFTTYLLYGALAVAAVGIFAVCFLAGEIPQEKMPAKKSPVVALLSGIFGITLAVNATEQFSSFSKAYSSADILMRDPEQTMMSYLMKSGDLPRLGEAVFAALSIIYFITLVINYIGLKTVDFTKLKALSLCPLFWATFRMVQRFTRTISFMNVSSLLLELFMIAFMMMFFMYFAQMSSNVNATAISYKVFSYGLIAAMLAAVVSIPKALLLIFDSSYRELMEKGLLECNFEATDLAFCLFAVAMLVLCLASPRIKNMTLKETEKLIAVSSEEEK